MQQKNARLSFSPHTGTVNIFRYRKNRSDCACIVFFVLCITRSLFSRVLSHRKSNNLLLIGNIPIELGREGGGCFPADARPDSPAKGDTNGLSIVSSRIVGKQW